MIRTRVGSGSVPPRSWYIPSNIGTTNRSIADTMSTTMPSDDDRVGHRRLDLAPQLHLLLERVGQAEHDLVEHAADLAGADHGEVDGREHLRVAGHRLRERQTLLDVQPSCRRSP